MEGLNLLLFLNRSNHSVSHFLQEASQGDFALHSEALHWDRFRIQILQVRWQLWLLIIGQYSLFCIQLLVCQFWLFTVGFLISVWADESVWRCRWKHEMHEGIGWDSMWESERVCKRHSAGQKACVRMQFRSRRVCVCRTGWGGHTRVHGSAQVGEGTWVGETYPRNMWPSLLGFSLTFWGTQQGSLKMVIT